MIGLAILTVVIGLAVAATAVPARRIEPALATARAGAAEQRLLSRFIERSQRFRRNGAIVGIVLMVAARVVSDAVSQHPAEAAIDLVALATIGLAGSIGGSMVAEAFRLRRPHGPRVASLAPRDTSQYRDASADRRERAVLVLAAIGVLLSIVSGTGLRTAVLIAAAIVALAVLRRWAIRRIAYRPRPALSPDLARVDDEVRRLAASAGISRPVITLGALLVSTQWFAAVSAGHEAGERAEAIDLIAQVGGTGLFLTACVWWWKNRSFGLTTEQLGSGVGPRSRIGIWVAALVLALVAAAALVVLARST